MTEIHTTYESYSKVTTTELSITHFYLDRKNKDTPMVLLKKQHAFDLYFFLIDYYKSNFYFVPVKLSDQPSCEYPRNFDLFTPLAHSPSLSYQ